MNRRHDSLAAEPLGRATASWIENVPNARGNVPHITRLHCDVRHTSADAAIEMEALLRLALSVIAVSFVWTLIHTVRLVRLRLI
jgi:hypothetical protein